MSRANQRSCSGNPNSGGCGKVSHLCEGPPWGLGEMISLDNFGEVLGTT